MKNNREQNYEQARRRFMRAVAEPRRVPGAALPGRDELHQRDPKRLTTAADSIAPSDQGESA